MPFCIDYQRVAKKYGDQQILQGLSLALEADVTTAIVGASGSGKSTFSRELAAALSVRHVEMDAIHWLADWHELNDEQFAAQLERALVADSWVLDGNYSRFNDLKWALTDTIIWLDYSLPRTFAQILARSVRRALTGVEIWPGTGNTETLYRNFCSRDSVILWMMIMV